jgi:NAD(P)-dependent dehydrogenase (short-subunit alcohol dehydrogenase family)
MFAINVLGSILCAREAVRRMSTRHGGGRRHRQPVVGRGAAGLAPGSTWTTPPAKGAIDTFTLGLAREVAAEGVRVNAVRPGIIDTEIHASGGQPDRAKQLAPMVPMQRAGSADEVAAGHRLAAGRRASYTTGAVLDVTGGR